MDNVVELKTEKMSKLFFKYFIPTLMGMLVTAIHILIDGIFVGRGIGSLGVAAVNIVVPLFTICTGIGFLVGVGGSTLVSINNAKEDYEKSARVFSGSIIIMIILGTVLTILGLVFIKPMALFLGASEEILPMVLEYMFIVLLFTNTFIIATAMNNFLRADGAPKVAMIVTLLGSLINAILNYFFIFEFSWGMKGAGIATGIGNVLALFITIWYFKYKSKNLRFRFIKLSLKETLEIFKIGTPSFLSEIGISVVTLLHNLIMMSTLGAKGVSAYGVVSYIYPFMMLIFLALTLSMQPVISYNYGAGEHKRVKEGFSLVLKMALLLGVLFYLSGVFFSEEMVALFIVDDMETKLLASEGVRLFFINFLFFGVNLAFAMYYQSIEKSTVSTVITLFRAIIIISIVLYTLPNLIGRRGIWLATPIAEAITFVGILIYVAFDKRKNLKLEEDKAENLA